jgi:hypothetical protein
MSRELKTYYNALEYLIRYHRKILLSEFHKLCACRKMAQSVVYPACVFCLDFLPPTDGLWLKLRFRFWEGLLQRLKEKHPAVMMELYLLEILH